MLANWVKQAVSAGGTGTLTLGSADAGHIDLSTAVVQGPRFIYSIEDGNNRETGIGYLSASTTLVRATVLETLVAGAYDNTSPAAINVTTAAKVMIAPAEQNVMQSAAAPMGNFNLNGIVFDALGSGQSTVTMAANRMTISSFLLPCSGYFSGMNLYVSTAAAGGLVAGFFQTIDNSSMAKVVQTGEIDCSGAVGQRTGNFSANKYLSAGWYTLAVLSGGAIGIHSDTAGGRGNLGGEWIGGGVLSRYNGSITYTTTLADAYTLNTANWNNVQTGKLRVGLVRA